MMRKINNGLALFTAFLSLTGVILQEGSFLVASLVLMGLVGVIWIFTEAREDTE